MLQEETIRTRDGQQIGLSIFRPEGDPPDRVVLIGPGAGMEQSFYKPIALFLVSHGMAAVTFDYRGTGRSRNGRLRHFRATLKQWGTHDLDAVLELGDWLVGPPEVVGGDVGPAVIGPAVVGTAVVG